MFKLPKFAAKSGVTGLFCKVCEAPPRATVVGVAFGDQRLAQSRPQGLALMFAANFLQGKSPGSAAIGPGALATSTSLAMGVKSARK
ncbi:MAG: hypothetical protein RIQ60_4518 [Pseudomonadota bacterium]